MDTQSEQAPHTGSGIGNDSCKISNLKKIKILFFSSAQQLMDCCAKNGTDLTLRRGYVAASCGHLRDYLLLAPQRWVTWCFLPHLVFVVSPWRDDLYYLGREIKEGLSILIPWSLHLSDDCTTALLHCKMWPWSKTGRKNKNKSKKTASLLLLSLQCPGSCSLDAFDADNSNCCLFLSLISILLLSVYHPLHEHLQIKPRKTERPSFFANFGKTHFF